VNGYKKIIMGVALIVGAGAVGYYLYQDDVADNGMAYASKITLCQQFAQSYLKTVRKSLNIQTDSPEWDMAIDVETDMYNLCLVELNPEALKNFKTTA
jgi:hypothetical protein